MIFTKNLKFKILFFILLHLIFSRYYCSIDLRSQSKFSEVCPDTSSFVMLVLQSTEIRTIKDGELKWKVSGGGQKETNRSFSSEKIGRSIVFQLKSVRFVDKYITHLVLDTTLHSVPKFRFLPDSIIFQKNWKLKSADENEKQGLTDQAS